MQKPQALHIVILFTALVVNGCGGDTPVPVSGTVRHNGRPVSQGSVNLAPVGGGKPAAGSIRADGTFEMQLATERGTASAAYYVTVAGELVQKKSTKRVLFVGPRDKPLEIVVGRENTVEIDINERDGWKIVND